MRKPANYYTMLRADILPYIPDEANSILSLGCGAALTEGRFRKSHDCKITGIELSPVAAKLAKEQIDEVIVGNLAAVFDKVKDRRFDCILALDVLEHLADPWTALKKYTSLLSDRGIVIASIPNINHHSIRAGLTLDLFPYCEAGILDFTHMRFFTLTEIYKLFAIAGLKISQTNAFKNRMDPIQYIVVGRPVSSPTTSPLVTIVIPTLNNLAYTKKCIESLRKNTKVSYRLIVVDNGSSDGTRAWLTEQRDLIHIPNIVNLGFGIAVNQGLQCVTSPYTVIANNDILFSPEWCSHLLDHFKKDPKIGLVGSKSNFVSGPQIETSLIDATDYSINAWTKKYYESHKGNSREFQRLVFFCVMIKKEVLDKIGLLDERFTLGNFEDDDFCLRATMAGFKLLIADDTFIYHYGSTTFRSEKIDYNKILLHNQKKFQQKWGKIIR